MATPSVPRKLRDVDVEAFMRAAQDSEPVRKATRRGDPTSIPELMSLLSRRDPIRVRRFRRDTAWVTKHARRHGIMP